MRECGGVVSDRIYHAWIRAALLGRGFDDPLVAQCRYDGGLHNILDLQSADFEVDAERKLGIGGIECRGECLVLPGCRLGWLAFRDRGFSLGGTEMN